MKPSVRKVLAPVVIAVVALASTGRTAAAADPCPAIGEINGCNLIFTIGIGNIVTQVLGLGGLDPYDGAEDALIGIVNNSGNTLFGMALTGSDIFGFDGDGICDPVSTWPNNGAPNGQPACTWSHPTGYEGPNTTFTITDSNSGIVNFTGGLASGATAYFSLEEPPTPNGITANPITNPTTTTPEPSTITLCAMGLVGLAGVTRKRRQNQS